MAKKYVIRVAGFLGFAMLVFTFQNCARSSFETADMSSTDSTLGSLNQTPVEVEPPEIEEDYSSSNKLLMDRSVIHSLLADNFGPSAVAIPSMVVLKSARFVLGGPCSYNDYFKSLRAGSKIDYDAENCGNSETSANLSASLLPSANVIHQSLITDVCQDILATAEPVTYMLNKINGNATGTVPESSDENILKLFKLFYRGKPAPPQSLIFSLKTIVGSPATRIGWKDTALNLCLSSHWQVL